VLGGTIQRHKYGIGFEKIDKEKPTVAFPTSESLGVSPSKSA
jgi:hypothetical protein